MGYSKVNLEEIEPAGPGGAVRFIRRELGLEAFGINWFELPPHAPGVAHDEAESGQEEVNVIIRGSGTYTIDGEEVPVRGGDVFRFDPETHRQPTAGPDGMTFFAVGSPRGSYVVRAPY
jgi:mannose-6-phosphate isomerase-like protein (cupin superfamily)